VPPSDLTAHNAALVVPRDLALSSAKNRSLTGKGASVLLLDAGIDASHILGENFFHAAQFGAAQACDHSYKIASICGDHGPESLPCGVAPEARYTSAARSAFEPATMGDPLDQLKQQHGPFHVACIAWSAPTTTQLATWGREWALRFLDQGTLLVAAVGHDGEGKVRIPALWPEVLAVGVHDDLMEPTRYTSRSSAFEKPEIYVKDENFFSRTSAAEVGAIKGTSAAAGFVTGIAALYVEWLNDRNLPSDPLALKATILSASEPMPSADGRILKSEKLFPEVSCLSRFDCVSGVETIIRLEKAGNEAGQIAVSSSPQCLGAEFLSAEFSITATITSGVEEKRLVTRNSSLVIDVPSEWSGEIDLTLSTTGAKFSAAVSGNNVQIKTRSASRLKQRKIITLGISASHNASACILEGHDVLRAVQLERITRVKYDGEASLNRGAAAVYCLESVGLDTSDVGQFAYNVQSVLPGWCGLSRPVATADFKIFDPCGSDSVFVSHHLAHAFAAYSASPFRDALVIVADGAGGAIAGNESDLLLSGQEMLEYLKRENRALPGIHVMSTYIFDTESFRLVDRETAPSFNVRSGSSSLGETYAAVSQYIFGNWLDGGKLMGLAPYGRPETYPTFLGRDASGKLSFRSDWKLDHNLARRLDAMVHKDLAARIQRDFEEGMLDRVRAAVRKTGVNQIVLTGGLALNCVANERIKNESGCSEAFFFPASNDAGIAIGAAQGAVYKQTGSIKESHSRVWVDFLGHPYDERDCEIALAEASDGLVVEPLAIEQLAEEIARGWIIGWFQGGSEFGPRALGHRSILASPEKRATREFINLQVKGREDFRPFAPIVAEDFANEFFELDEPSPYMLRVVKIREQYREALAAVCHVDGSARVQTAGASALPELHSLLMLMSKFGHPPILLNTSMNVAGEPIIETPSEAIRLLLTTPLDALVLNSKLVRRRTPPDGLIGPNSILDLAPEVYTSEVIDRSSRQLTISSKLRGTGFSLSNDLYGVVSLSNGRKPVRDLLNPSHLQEAIPTLIALLRKGMLIYCGESDE
jgi:carbamoyltransferase